MKKGQKGQKETHKWEGPKEPRPQWEPLGFLGGFFGLFGVFFWGGEGGVECFGVNFVFCCIDGEGGLIKGEMETVG